MSFPLVDYGSDSDSDDGSSSKPIDQAVEEKLPDDFFGGGTSTHKQTVVLDTNEDALEDIVKPKDWEKKLAKQAKKEFKKNSKKAKKDKKKKKDKEDKNISEKSDTKKREKTKILAFGALKAIEDSDSDNDEKAKSKTVETNAPRFSGLLSMLPKPKVNQKTTSGSITSSSTTSLIPSSMRSKQPMTQSEPFQKRKIEMNDSDDDDDDNDGSFDFFGLSTQPEAKLAKIDDSVPMMGSSGLSSNIGPSRPTTQDTVSTEEMYPEFEESGPSRVISNEQAVKLLARDETIQFMERRSLTDIASNLLEVRVDDALGPNVKQNLLKSITKKAIVKDTMAPLPKNKGPVDPNARKRNQITYLANLAVDREEALQEQWAETKQMKRMTRQKYGF